MAFTEAERNEFEYLVSELIENRRMQATANGFKLGYKLNNQSIELFEIGCSSFESTEKCSINTHKMLGKVIL